MGALPEPIRAEAERALDSVVADPTSWGNPRSVLVEPRRDGWIEPLQQAVITRRRVELTYDTPRTGISRRPIDPLGLVVKQGHWYVVALTAAGQRSFRVDRVVGLESTDETFERPGDFDLETAWNRITTEYVANSFRVTTAAVVVDEAIPMLRSLGVETVVGERTNDGRTEVTLGAWSADVLAVEIAGTMESIELVDPPAGVVERLAEIGAELVSRFTLPPER